MQSDAKTVPVYAVVLNYRNYQDTIDCIFNLLKTSYENLRIIVVDNDSLNNSLENIQTWIETEERFSVDYKYHKEDEFVKPMSKITLVQAKANNGFASGNNIALKKLAEVDCYVFLVNPDVNVMPDSVCSLVEMALNNPRQIILGSQMLNYGDRSLKYFGGVRLNSFTGTVNEIKDENDKNFDYICGGAVFFHSSILNEVGLLPDGYFLYWEDADWCYHAAKQGYKLLTCPGSIVYDKGATSIGRGYLAEYYYTRNSLIFHRKIGKQVFTIIFSNLFFRFPKKVLSFQIERAKAVVGGTWDFMLKKYVNAPKKNFNFS